MESNQGSNVESVVREVMPVRDLVQAVQATERQLVSAAVSLVLFVRSSQSILKQNASATVSEKLEGMVHECEERLGKAVDSHQAAQQVLHDRLVETHPLYALTSSQPRG